VGSLLDIQTQLKLIHRGVGFCSHPRFPRRPCIHRRRRRCRHHHHHHHRHYLNIHNKVFTAQGRLLYLI